MSDRETQGEQGKEMQLNEYDAYFLNSVKKIINTETQYVAAGVESVAHRHKLVYVWETLGPDRTLKRAVSGPRATCLTPLFSHHV